MCRATFPGWARQMAICREFRVSWKVVRKVIRSQATEFRYEHACQPLPQIDPWRKQLDDLLLANEGSTYLFTAPNLTASETRKLWREFPRYPQEALR
jgi:hypothetical protein